MLTQTARCPAQPSLTHLLSVLALTQPFVRAELVLAPGSGDGTFLIRPRDGEANVRQSVCMWVFYGIVFGHCWLLLVGLHLSHSPRSPVGFSVGVHHTTQPPTTRFTFPAAFLIHASLLRCFSVSLHCAPATDNGCQWATCVLVHLWHLFKDVRLISSNLLLFFTSNTCCAWSSRESPPITWSPRSMGCGP